MTDIANNETNEQIIQPEEQVPLSNVASEQAEQNSPVPAETKEQPQEKLLKQSEANILVGAVKKETAERVRREVLQELQKENVVNDASTSSGIDVDQIRRIVEQTNEEAANKAIGQKVLVEFTQKMLAAKDRYSDFTEVVSDLDLREVPDLVFWTNSLDNTADVMYDIAKNPSKFASVLALREKNPRLAMRELQKLSTSIKQNQEAQLKKVPVKPLSEMTPSIAGTDSGGMTIADRRRASYLMA